MRLVFLILHNNLPLLISGPRENDFLAEAIEKLRDLSYNEPPVEAVLTRMEPKKREQQIWQRNANSLRHNQNFRAKALNR